MEVRSITDILAEQESRKKQGDWTPACGGKETWAKTSAGKEAMYVYQASSGRHGWLGRDDIVYMDEALSEIID